MPLGDNGWSYSYLEYYRGELIGRKQVMTAMSNYSKGKIDGELLAKAYHIIALRGMVEDDECDFGDYTKEGLVLAGLKEEKK